MYESFVGALFLAFGYNITEVWVVRSFEEYTDISEIVRRVINPRERLTNFCISMHGVKPRVDVTRGDRPDGSGDTFVARVYHPVSGDLVSEGHAASSGRAVGDACDSAMEIILACRAPLSSSHQACGL